MEKTMRCLLKGIHVEDRFVPRMVVKSYLLFSIICLSREKLILATFVILLDKGNSFSDGKRVNMMIDSELGLVNEYMCIFIGYKWTDLGRFIAPLFVYWCHIIESNHGLDSLRCDDLQLFVFDPIILMVGFDVVPRVSMIKYSLFKCLVYLHQTYMSLKYFDWSLKWSCVHSNEARLLLERSGGQSTYRIYFWWEQISKGKVVITQIRYRFGGRLIKGGVLLFGRMGRLWNRIIGLSDLWCYYLPGKGVGER